MYQLPLNITPRLPYTAESFVMHQGVWNVVEFCLSQMLKDEFSICVVYGEAKSGKTHLSMKLAADLAQKGAKLRLLDGVNLRTFLEEQGGGAEYASGSVILIDNAEEYFMQLTPDRYGEFVNMVEALRRSKSGLIILTGRVVDDFPIDGHVRSRLRLGEGFAIYNPAEEEFPNLIDVMARQRGIKLSPKKISFLSKRIGRSVPAIACALNTLLLKCEEGAEADAYDVLASVV